MRYVTCTLSQRHIHTCGCLIEQSRINCRTPSNSLHLGDWLTSHSCPPAEGHAKWVKVSHISAQKSDLREVTSISISLCCLKLAKFAAWLADWLCLFAKCTDVRRWTGLLYWVMFKRPKFKRSKIPIAAKILLDFYFVILFEV